MRKPSYRTLLAAVLAVFALGAVTAASASAALPEFSLESKHTWPASYTGKLGSGAWKMPNGAIFSCKVAIQGQISGAKTITSTTVTFSECRAGASHCPTGQNGEHEGEVKTEPLGATLVYRSKSAKTVGIVVKAQSGTALAKFHCNGITAEVRGSVLLSIESVNKMGSLFTLKTYENGKYENEAGEMKAATLETNWPSIFLPMGWEFAGNVETNQNVEVKA